MRILLVNRF